MKWIVLGLGILGTKPFVALLIITKYKNVSSILCMMVAALFSVLGGFWPFMEMYVRQSVELKLRLQSKKEEMESKDN